MVRLSGARQVQQGPGSWFSLRPAALGSIPPVPFQGF